MGAHDLLQDLRYAVRSVVRHAGVTAIHVLLIAVSIGLTCSAFIVMDVVLLRSLPAISDPYLGAKQLQ